MEEQSQEGGDVEMKEPTASVEGPASIPVPASQSGFKAPAPRKLSKREVRKVEEPEEKAIKMGKSINWPGRPQKALQNLQFDLHWLL